jgi:hypothetical protein
MSFVATFERDNAERPLELRVPGKPLCIVIGSGLARQLEPACASVYPRSGGLLLGQVAEGDISRVSVDECLPLQWDRAFGGAPFLTEAQEKQLEANLSRNERRVVGWYRAADNTGPAVLSDADVDLFDACFQRPSDICLVAGNGPEGFHAAMFARDVHGAIGKTARPDLDLPLYRLQGSAERDGPWLLQDQARLWLKVGLGIISVAILVLLARRAGIGPAHASTPETQLRSPMVTAVMATATPDSPLHLQVSSTAERLTLTWKPEGVNGLRCGVLSIDEGSAGTAVALGPDKLREGTFSYQSKTGSVNFRLDVLTADRRLISGRTRFVDGSKPVTFTPLSARFELQLPADDLDALNGGAQSAKLCEAVPIPLPNSTPRLVASAKPLGGPAFTVDNDELQPTTGTITLTHGVLLSEYGHIVDVRSPDSRAYGGVSATLAQAIRQWKFSPATLDGIPVATKVNFSFTIRLLPDRTAESRE